MGFKIRKKNFSDALRPPFKLTDELFKTLLDYYTSYFELEKVNPEIDTRNPLSSSFIDEFPGGDLINFRITDSQFKEILRYCFNEKYNKETDKYFKHKYAFALKSFNFCVASLNVEKNPTKRDIKLFALYLDRLMSSGLTLTEMVSCDLIHTSYSGLGKLTAEYLEKLDIFMEDDDALTYSFLKPTAANEGFSYRGYNNARTFNYFLKNNYDEEVKDVFDLDRYILPDNFPYVKREERKDDIE